MAIFFMRLVFGFWLLKTKLPLRHTRLFIILVKVNLLCLFLSTTLGGGGGDRDTSIIDLDISREPHALSEEREPDIY